MTDELKGHAHVYVPEDEDGRRRMAENIDRIINEKDEVEEEVGQ